METIKLQDGKYIITNNKGVLKAFRHGEEWRDIVGDNLIYALVQKVNELEDELCQAIDVIEDSGVDYEEIIEAKNSDC